MTGLDELQKALDTFPEKAFHYDPSVVNIWLRDFREKFAVFRQSLPFSLVKEHGLRKLVQEVKSKISSASFDGWVENGSENCDGFEEHVQLVREKDVLDALASIEQVFDETLTEKVSVDLQKQAKTLESLFGDRGGCVYSCSLAKDGRCQPTDQCSSLWVSLDVVQQFLMVKERSLRKLWEDFDIDNYDNDDVIEWYNESKKVFAQDFAAEPKDSVIIPRKQLEDHRQERRKELRQYRKLSDWEEVNPNENQKLARTSWHRLQEEIAFLEELLSASLDEKPHKMVKQK